MTKTFLYALLPALVLAAAILLPLRERDRIFYVEGNDEPAHTFVEIPLMQKNLKYLHILKINIFNNFGTPLIGDPVACPFAPHAATYAFFRPPVAMVVNMALFAFFSVLVLAQFFSRYLTPLSAAVASVTAVTTPSFYYFIHHHPHQGILFYFGLVLWLSEEVAADRRPRNLVLLYLAYVILMLGVGTNGLILGIPFLIVYHCLRSGWKWREVVSDCLLPVGIAFLAVHAHLLYFAKLALSSQRREADLGKIAVYSGRQIVTGLFACTQAMKFHTDVSLAYSVPLLLLAVLGIVAGRATVERSTARTLTAVLGVVPYGVVLLLLHFRFRWLVGYIPLLRAMDITRIWWFCNIFLALGVGLSLDAMLDGTLKPYLAKGLVTMALVLFGWRCWIELHPDPSNPPFGFRTAAGSTAALILLVGMYLAGGSWERLSAPLRVGTFLALLALFYPRYRASQYVTYVWQGTDRSLRFWPEEFLPLMKPLTRLASGGDPAPSSRDHRAGTHGILGSAGRSITLSKALREAFDRIGIIESGWHGLTYYFKPASPETLAKFGIRYFIAERDEQVTRLTELGWRQLRTVGGLSLFENPVSPTLFYRETPQGPEFLDDFEYRLDSFRFRIPPRWSGTPLVATFTALPGWRAEIDGVRVPITHGDDQMIRITPSGAGTLELVFEPYSDRYLVTSFILACLAAILVPLLLAGFGPRTGKRPRQSIGSRSGMERASLIP